MFNLFTLVLFAVGAGIVIAILVTRTAPPKGTVTVLPEEDFSGDDGNPLQKSDLFELGERLCKQNNLIVSQVIDENKSETLWMCQNDNDVFFGKFIFGFFEAHEGHELVTLQDILKFKDFVRGSGGNKGFYFTTWYFSRDVHQPLEGKEVAFYNKKRILEEIQNGRS